MDELAASMAFRVSILGGDWQKERVQRTIYGPRYDIKRGTAVHELATVFGLSLSASFDVHKHSDAGAAMLGEVWMERLLFLTRSWVAASKPASFERVVLGPFVLPERLQHVRAQLSPASAKRYDQIVALAPRA
eukprot:6455422-Amphidinium_carterae.7